MDWSRKPLLDEAAEIMAGSRTAKDLLFAGTHMVAMPSMGWGAPGVGRLEKHEARYLGRRLLALSRGR